MNISQSDLTELEHMHSVNARESIVDTAVIVTCWACFFLTIAAVACVYLLARS